MFGGRVYETNCHFFTVIGVTEMFKKQSFSLCSRVCSEDFKKSFKPLTTLGFFRTPIRNHSPSTMFSWK